MTEVRGEGDGDHDASDGGGGSRASPLLVSLSTKIMLLVIYLNELISFDNSLNTNVVPLCLQEVCEYIK